MQNVSAMHVMAEALPDPVIVLNPDGHVLFCNASARGLFASLREGSHISSVIRTPEFLDAVSAAPERGRAVTVTYAERVPVGRRMAATVAPLSARAASGAADILVLLRDLTEGERINQMRADFIANASHELSTPLASLRGFIETLQGSAKGDPGARERFLPIMAEQASRMTRLIDALLSLSRVEMNAHVPPSDLVDLNDVLDHAKDTLEPLARETGFTVRGGALPAAGGRARRPRRAASGDPEPGAERVQIRRARRPRRRSRRSTSPRSAARPAATPSPWSTMGPASRPSICRG